jgi:putative hydrolase of the HAD superfamily
MAVMTAASIPAIARADVAEVEAWIFDLDNTLYPASSNLFHQIDVRMKTYIAKLLGISAEEAFVLQKTHYRKHGTTLRGLMIHHDVDPDEFLDYVHDIDRSVLEPDLELQAALAALPGRKFVYTNGSEHHAAEVMARLGITGAFSGIFDIRAGNYIPKPDPAPYAAMIGALGIAPKRAAMFEDSFKNLKPAADLGMLTVWVRHVEHVPGAEDDLSHCRYQTDDMVGWLEEAASVLSPPLKGEG